MERDIAALIEENLEFLQGFDGLEVYYDDGQAIVKSALDNAAKEDGETYNKFFGGIGAFKRN